MAFENVSMYDVESSNISQIGYDDDEMTLYVSFYTGDIYWYSGVDQELWNSFFAAESKGKFLWAYIRGKYEYGRIK